MDSDSSSHSDDPGTSMDTDTALHIDTGTPMGTESRSNDNPGMNMDSELLVPEGNLLAGDEATTQRCVNCGTDLLQRRRHTLVLIDVRSIIQQWIAPRLIENDTLVCHSCWTLALHHSRTQASNDGSSTSGHRRNTCVNCGCSLMRTRSHTLNSNTERESQIRAIVMEQIAPHQLHGSDKICHPCWQRIDRAATRSTEVRHPNNNQPSIILPMYTRASGSQQFCFYPDCHSTQRLAAPKWLRIKLFTDYNFYVPQNCRICSFHLYNDNWEVLSNIQQPIHSFNAEHIQDFATFVNERQMVLDFSNIETLSNELTHYWIGLSKEQFQQLYLEVPGMQAVHRNKLALAAYLMKLRTGDSDQRIATLLNIPRTTLMRLMGKARDVLERAFVPNNLGINHLTRTEISERNLLIPNGLFGGVNRQPIIIIDGTYLYVQKSSNYMYQKDTYSLHKVALVSQAPAVACGATLKAISGTARAGRK
ncbi:uncharacterized protein LOC121729065 [Aricia agestis]|uniref:uncharacterized protein LOC121729065 n=1 Tax=Aricia agestis TaxID=91739 RepID=UPI001C20705B|nr:uncharacterized protein LOC121729065 [Aricia agestis]